jgi:hypothetical protein
VLLRRLDPLRRQARQRRMQCDQHRMIGDAVDAGGAEMALEGGDHFHRGAVISSGGRHAAAIFGERQLQVLYVVADGAEHQGFAARGKKSPTNGEAAGPRGCWRVARQLFE